MADRLEDVISRRVYSDRIPHCSSVRLHRAPRTKKRRIVCVAAFKPKLEYGKELRFIEALDAHKQARSPVYVSETLEPAVPFFDYGRGGAFCDLAATNKKFHDEGVGVDVVFGHFSFLECDDE
jgi:hypothetical protein